MAYSPINTQAYVSAYAGVLAGMAVSGWIVDPTSGDYLAVSAIAGAFSEAFDGVWNSAAVLNNLQIRAIQTVCQNEFAGRGPGSLDNADLALASHWSVPAAACAALVLQGDAYLASQGIDPGSSNPGGGAFDPIFQQLWLDTTKPAGGNGSIGTPYNTWADAVTPLEVGSDAPWAIFLAQGLDASGTPIPDLGAGGHATAEVKFQGVVASSLFAGGNDSLTGVVFSTQGNGRIIAGFENLTVVGIQLTGITILKGLDCILSSLTESGTATGQSNLINCSVNSVALPSYDLRMSGGTIDLDNSVANGFFDDVEFQSGCNFRWASTLNLTNCRFQAGAQLLCDSNQQLNLDLTTWGSMVAAGVTFPDTFPQMVITPWVPVLGQVLKSGTTTCTSGGITTVNAGVIAPQEAEASTACVAGLGNVQNSHLIVVGASINASRELLVLVSNVDSVDHDLVDVLFTTTYLPRLSP